MFFKQKFKKSFSVFLIIIILLLIIGYSDIAVIGVNRGILISTNIIIPSLFPFTVFVLMLVKSGINIKNRFLNKIIFKVFGLNCELFMVFFLSMVGGYPIGARLIAELYINKKIDKKTANIMLMYSVNAGPAFIISAIGVGIFRSTQIGLILLTSHIISSMLLAIIIGKKIRPIKTTDNFNSRTVTLSEIFTESVNDSAKSVLQICSYVILFSAISAFFEYFFKSFSIIYRLSYFLEVTSAVTKTDNIIFISFLLGFSGISIWFQIFAITDKISVNYLSFIMGRLFHATLSSLLTFVMLKHFKVSVYVYSNQIKPQRGNIYSNIPVSLSLVVMVTVLLIFIYSKNSSRKLLDDVI